MVSDNMDKQQQQYLEGVELLTSSQPREIYRGVIKMDPTAYRVDEIIEAVGQERLIRNCLLALGFVEHADPPPLERILSHFPLADLIAVYRRLGPARHRYDIALFFMVYIEDLDLQLTCLMRFFAEHESEQPSYPRVTTDPSNFRYWRICVDKLISDSEAVARGAAQELAAHQASIAEMMQAVGQDQLIEFCLHCWGNHPSTQNWISQLLSYFSMQTILNMYARRIDEALNEGALISPAVPACLFWLMEERDPAFPFQWIDQPYVPKYPLYDPKTSDRLNPWTGEFDPEED
jgi:hypothetical protein